MTVIEYVPVSVEATGSGDDWTLTWEVWEPDGTGSLPDAMTRIRVFAYPEQATFIARLEHRGGTLPALTDVLDGEGQPLKHWGHESYRAVARNVSAVWMPTPGTVAAGAPEEDQ